MCCLIENRRALLQNLNAQGGRGKIDFQRVGVLGLLEGGLRAFTVCTWVEKGSVEQSYVHLKTHTSEASRRMPIVLGTFTSSSRKFVDLSYHALLFIDA